MAYRFQLPEGIIQHIQSNLDSKEAARTSVLSKSWYAAWSTRPVLSFEQCHYSSNYWSSIFEDPTKFLRLVGKTLQRYERLNLKVDKFLLSIDGELKNATRKCIVNDLINKVLKLGVNELDLGYLMTGYHLPAQVFTTTSLSKLSVFGFNINELFQGRVLCSRLVSLYLLDCEVSDSVIRDILSACPLIEYLNLNKCAGLKNVDVSNLKKLVDLRIIHGSVDFEGLDPGSITSMVTYCNLRALVLCKVTVHDKFFSEFSRKFPCVETLTVKDCIGFEEIQISSHSVKHLTLGTLDMSMKMHLDVPNICDFTFCPCFSSEDGIPSDFFCTASREWVSRIDICHEHWSDIETDWFLELREFLKKLSGSRVTLCIGKSRDFYKTFCNSYVFFTAVVENVSVHMYTSLDLPPHEYGNLFRIFRPDFITRTEKFCQCADISSEDSRESSLKLVREALAYSENNQKCSNSMQIVLGLNDLEEVTLELFDESVLEWYAAPMKNLIKAPKARLRFTCGAFTSKDKAKSDAVLDTFKGRLHSCFAGNFPYSAFEWFTSLCRGCGD